jgi:hypothetical protein
VESADGLGVEDALSRRLPLALVTLSIALLLGCGLSATVAAAAPSQGPSAQQVEEDILDEDFEDDFDEEDLGGDEEFFGEDPEEEEIDPGDLAQVAALEQATGELGRAKRAAAGKLGRLSRGSAALKPCLRRGPGWKRIRSIDHRPQRSLYTASARRMLAEMKTLLDGQQARIVAYEGAFERFVAQLRAAPVSDVTLSDAIAAQARRLAAYRDLRAVKASCAIFNKLTRRVREFPTRSAAQIVRADYRAAPRARKIERHISNQLARIDRRHGITYRDAETLADAAEVMVELGGEPGYATGFQYALSLR